MTRTEKSLLAQGVGKAKPAVRNGAWMVGGIVISAVFTVAAQQYSAVAAGEPCALTDAMSAAVNDKVKLVAMTTSDPAKYFNQNCLGDLAFANIDLSKLIPDPMGVLTSAAMSGLEAMKKAATGKVCAAARNAVGDTIGQYNTAINTINGGNAALTQLIDSSIANQAQKVSDQFNMNYNTQSSVSPAVTPTAAASWSTSPVPAAASSYAASPAAAAEVTTAAGNLEQARLSLQYARQAAGSSAAGSVASAQQSYDQALSAYNAAQQRATGAPAQPQVRQAAPATVGGAIF